jgi:hypothetical protein
MEFVCCLLLSYEEARKGVRYMLIFAVGNPACFIVMRSVSQLLRQSPRTQGCLSPSRTALVILNSNRIFRIQRMFEIFYS